MWEVAINYDELCDTKFLHSRMNVIENLEAADEDTRMIRLVGSDI